MHFPWSANTDRARRDIRFIRFVVFFLVAVLITAFSAADSDAARSRKKPAKDKKTVACKKTNKKTEHKKRSAKVKKHSRKLAKKPRSVEERSSFIPDSNPLMKVVPLDNRKYLLEPLDKTSWNNSQDEIQNFLPEVFYQAELGPSADAVLAANNVTDLTTTAPETITSADQEEAAKENEGYYARFTNLLVGTVKQLVGAPYKFGGSSILKGIDCSAFVREVFSKFAISLPRSSREQVKVGMLITHVYDRAKLQIGDVLFFRHSPTSRQIGHTGIYIGNGKMAHAARGSRGVTISSLDKAYYQKTFVAAKRFFVFTEPKASET